jgi:hypothetical protein
VTTITVPRAVLEQALEALEAMKAEFRALDLPYGSKAYAAGNQAAHGLRAALAQQEQEPVAWVLTDLDGKPIMEFEAEPFVRLQPSLVGPDTDWTPLYTHPPRREWQSLTEDEIRTAYGNDLKYRDGDYERFARAVEQALKEKNQ